MHTLFFALTTLCCTSSIFSQYLNNEYAAYQSIIKHPFFKNIPHLLPVTIEYANKKSCFNIGNGNTPSTLIIDGSCYPLRTNSYALSKVICSTMLRKVLLETNNDYEAPPCAQASITDYKNTVTSRKNTTENFTIFRLLYM